jgi:hypothetical protein
MENNRAKLKLFFNFLLISPQPAASKFNGKLVSGETKKFQPSQGWFLTQKNCWGFCRFLE